MSRSTDLLVAIDLQPAFSHPDSPWFTPSLADAYPGIERLSALFGARSVFTRFVPPAHPVGSWVDYYRRYPWALDRASDWLWALDPSWRGRPSVQSHRLGKWLPDIRDRVAPDAAVVLCGVAIDCCVLMTALAAVDDGARVRVVADACAAKTAAGHVQALELMASRAPQLTVVSLADELARQEARA